MAPSSTHLSPAELSYLHTSLSSHPPIRPDARLATDFRPLNAETGVLPNTMGSAHVGFADGREAVVGVRAEVERTVGAPPAQQESTAESRGGDVEMDDDSTRKLKTRGKSEWVTLSLNLSGLRDDDKDLVFLEEMLREVLVATSHSSSNPTESAEHQGHSSAMSLQDALIINYRWHWHLYIDVILISPPDSSASNYPLPLLSMAVHLALRDTKLPRLKSEGDEDPVADDDWDAAVTLYSRTSTTRKERRYGLLRTGLVPPVTLLAMVAGENVIFDPSSRELSVADGVLAVSVGRSTVSGSQSDGRGVETSQQAIQVLGLRMLETGARDTMKGIPREVGLDGVKNAAADAGSTDQVIPGVWKPKVGGLKRNVIMKVMKAVIGVNNDSESPGGVGREVLDGLDGFMIAGGS